MCALVALREKGERTVAALRPSRRRFARDADPPLIFYALTWLDHAAAASAALCVAIIYLRTCAPTVTGEDAGELIAAAWCYGVPHPPGYPLWTLLAHIFTHLPFGHDAAWRANLLSVCFGCLTAWLVALITMRLSGNRWAGAGAGLLVGFSRSFWSQALIAEVYTLNAFFLALCLFWTVEWMRTGKVFYVYLWCATVSAACANHYPLTVLAIPGMALSVLMMRRPVLKGIRQYCTAGLLLVSGIWFYVHEMFRARGNPPMNWGTPDTWERLLAHVMRQQYKSLDLGRDFSPHDVFLFIGNFFREWASQWSFFMLPLVLLGIWYLWKRCRPLAAGFLVIALVNSFGLVFMLHYAFTRENVMRVMPYYLPTYVICALFIGVALWRIHEWLCRVTAARRWPSWTGALAGAAVVCAVAALPCAMNYRMNDFSRNFIAYDYAVAALKGFEKEAIVIPSGDNHSFPMVYLQVVEGLRPDVMIANVTGNLSPEAIALYHTLPEAEKGASDRDMEASLIARGARPVYFMDRGDIPRITGFEIRPECLAYRVCKAGAPGRGTAGAAGALNKVTLRGGEAITPSLSDMDLSLMASLHMMRGEELLHEGKSDEALAEFHSGAEIGKELSEWLNNLGSSCAEQGRNAWAEEFFTEALAAEPSNRTPGINLAKLWKSERRFDDALAQLEKHCAIHPGDEEAEQMKSEIGQFIAESDRLIADQERACASAPGDRAAYNDLGTTYARRGWYDRANEAYQKALNIDPAYECARKNLEALRGEQAR